VTSARNHADDLRAIGRLLTGAVTGVTDLVEEVHHTIGGGPAILGRPFAMPVRLFTAPVYASIRAVTGVVGITVDTALAGLDPLLGESRPGPARAALLAALNGVFGDELAAAGSPLAVAMHLQHAGARVDLAALSNARPKVMVLVHGSSMHPGQWSKAGVDGFARLGEELGYTVLHLAYNSGLHVSANGRAFAELLEEVASCWPVSLEEIVLIGHSMGGLVSRSACRAAEEIGAHWRTKLRKMIFLGTPHHGAPLERGGSLVELLLSISPYSAPFAKLGRIRSAGVTDLRHGTVLDDDRRGRDRFAFGGDRRTPCPLPRDVACFAVAGTTAAAGARSLPGDGLVPLASALGRHARPEHDLSFPSADRFVAHATGHIELLHAPAVHAAVRGFLARPPVASLD
jgi:pimeloyl-ACP methyl ester carboxylesterase